MYTAADPINSAMAALSISGNPPRNAADQSSASVPPALTVALPTVTSLTVALPTIQNPGGSPASKLAWCRDVLSLVDRLHASRNFTAVASEPPPPGPIHIADQQLYRLVQVAVPLVILISEPQPTPSQLPVHVAEAIYLRATFTATGAYPQFVQHSPRAAFRDYERAARCGFTAAWFKLGRDYETFGDFAHAKDCFERGAKGGDESSLYVTDLLF